MQDTVLDLEADGVEDADLDEEPPLGEVELWAVDVL